MDSSAVDRDCPSTIATIGVVAAAAILWIIVLALFLLFVPAYERVFADFQVRLPYITVSMIAVSHWCMRYLAIMPMELLVIAAGVAGSTWFIRHQMRRRWLAHLWCLAMLLLPTVPAAVIVLACYLPYAKLMEALAGQNG